MPNLKHKGFTLIELAIVIVIIGVLSSVIVGAQNMIENSKKTTIITELTTFKSAYEQFEDKYYSVPGDMSDAEDVWGSGNTDNGDGDGKIEDDADGNATVNRASEQEDMLAWQHLGFSDLIKGRYNGNLSASTKAEIDEDIPSGPHDGSGYTFDDRNTMTSSNLNSIAYGAYRTLHYYDNAVLAPQEAFSIDKKVDDMNPSEGQLITTNGNGGTTADCTTVGSAGDQDDTYSLSNKDKDCYIIYYFETTD